MKKYLIRYDDRYPGASLFVLSGQEYFFSRRFDTAAECFNYIATQIERQKTLYGSGHGTRTKEIR